MNPYIGDMPLDVNGERFMLRFDYTALSRVRAALGKDGQAAALAGDLEKLPILIAIGLAHHHPDVTVAMIIEASPTIVATRQAVDAALIAAYFGPSGVPEEQEGPNPPKPPRILLKRLWRRLFGAG